MWSVYLDTNPARMLATRALGLASRRAYYSPVAPLRTRQVRKPTPPGRAWVRVRNSVAGISGTDLALVHLQSDQHIASSALPRPRRIYLGHEVAGEVVEVGPEVAFLRVGDRVAYQLDQCCATRAIEPPCRHCAAGNYSLCENRYLPGDRSVGGGWGDEMILNERQLFLVPDPLSDEQAALLEPSAIAAHAALRHHPQPGDNVLVIGAGTIGLLVTQILRALSPNANITVQSRHDFQGEMAQEMGASDVLRVEDDGTGAAWVTGGKHFARRNGAELLIGGFDVIYDTVGTAATLQRSLRWARAGGVVVQAGMHLTPMHLDLTPIWQHEVRVLGAAGHGTESWPGSAALVSLEGETGGRLSTFALAAEMIREGRLTPERLVTHRFPLREVRRALATARDKAAHRAIKVLLDIRPVASTVAVDAEPAGQQIAG
jgi:threonine dehydrogenase-like Zn-dependent dehydrogenase